MNKNFPKENEKKLKETIKALRSERRSLLKEIKRLKEEVENIQKPIRKRTIFDNITTKEQQIKDIREDFAKRFKESIKKE